MTQSGIGVRSDEYPAPYVGQLPLGSVRELRKLLSRSLRGAGFPVEVVAGLTGQSKSSVARDVAGVELEVDDSMPPEVPPGIGPPEPRRLPAFVEVSAQLVAVLKRDYGRGVATDDGRQLGDLAEVREWVESLKPGKVKPAR